MQYCANWLVCYKVTSRFVKVALSLFSIQLLFSKNGNGGVDLSRIIFFFVKVCYDRSKGGTVFLIYLFFFVC